MEHGPSTTLLRPALLWTAFSSLAEVVPPFHISNSASRLQLFLCRPLFLFPCGFQGSAWRVLLLVVLLMVFPIHLLAESVWRLVPVLLFAIAPYCFILLDPEDTPQTGFNKRRYLLHHSGRSPGLWNVEPGRSSNVGIEDAEFCGNADLLWGPHVIQLNKGCSSFPNPGCHITVAAPLPVDHTSYMHKRLKLRDWLSIHFDWR